MTSDDVRTSDHADATPAYAWAWLPGHAEPVVVGRLRQRGDRIVFGYGESYLARPDALSLYGPELPLRPGTIEPLDALAMPGCLRDGSPDAWGRRVIEARLGVAGQRLERDRLSPGVGEQPLRCPGLSNESDRVCRPVRHSDPRRTP
ncbi:HipA N-terminal domain-containing protein [Nostocoides sp.]